jgi:inosose dehydratase
MKKEHIACYIDPCGAGWEEGLESLATLNYPGVEGIDALYKKFAHQVELAQRMLTQTNIQLISLSRAGDFVIPEKRHEILQNFRPVTDFLHRIGAKYIIINTGSPNIVEDIRRDFKVAAQTLNELGKQCQEHEIYACIQPTIGSRVATEEEIDRIMNQVDTREISLCPDTAQLRSAQLDPIHILKIYGECVRHIHLTDIPHAEDPAFFSSDKSSTPLCAPGEGIIDFNSIMNMLHSLKYNGWLTVKCGDADLPSTESAASAKDYIENILSNINCEDSK